MTTLLLIAAFVALAGLFAHGATSSIANPRPTDLELEQEASDGLYEVLKAVFAGIGLLLAGIGVLSVF